MIKISRRLLTVLFAYLLGLLSSYVIYLLIKKFSMESSLSFIVKEALSYKVLVKGSNPITLGTIVMGLILIVLGFYLASYISDKIATKILPRFNLDIGAIASLHNLTFYLLLISFILFALHVANVPLTMFTVMGGALAIGVGFGSQNILNNFISGIILQIERPIRVGDIIEVDGSRGTVKHIGTRRTTIVASNGSAFIVPNSHFLEKKILNISLLEDKTKVEIRAVVKPETDIESIKALVENHLSSIKEIIPEPKPTLRVTGYLDSGHLVLTVGFWMQLYNLKNKSEIENDCLILIQKTVKSQS